MSSYVFPTYDEHIAQLITKLPNNKYIFEVTKCCNYSTFVLVDKKSSLIDLYKAVSLHFECYDVKMLFLKNPEKHAKLNVPITEMITIKMFVTSNPAFFKPIYPLPNQVVYRIYLDDGHLHAHDDAKVFNEGL